MRRGIQEQLREKIGEVAYTPTQVSEMVRNLELEWYVDGEGRKIRDYVKEKNLWIDLNDLGVHPIRESCTKYWIPKSNLQRILDGLEIPATAKDLEEAAERLGYQF